MCLLLDNLYINRHKNFNKLMQELTLSSTRKINLKVDGKESKGIKRKTDFKQELTKKNKKGHGSKSVSMPSEDDKSELDNKDGVGVETEAEKQVNEKLKKPVQQQNKKNKLKFA
jgi:hypothetical protein